MCAVASGDLIVSGSEDTTARVWSISRGECVHELKGHETPLYSMIFLKDKSKVAAGASDGAICIWDVRNGYERPPLVDANSFSCPNLTMKLLPILTL